MESMKVAGHAYNYLKNASGRQETEVYDPFPSQCFHPLLTFKTAHLSRRKRSNKKDRSTSDSVVDAATRMALYKVFLALKK